MNKFKYLETILHVASGKKYFIVGTPDAFRLEATDRPAYAYAPVDDNVGLFVTKVIWVRDAEEMEDGRFVTAEE